MLSDEDDCKDVSFEYTKYPDEVDSKRLNFVVIPSKKINKRTALKALNTLSGRVSSLFWCGKKISYTLRKACERNKIRYWDETIDNFKLTDISCEVPMIQFFGESEIAEKTIFSLKSLFLKDGYNSLLVSDREQVYLYGFKKLYNKGSIGVYVFHFMPDVILIENQEKITDDEDVTVECTGNGFKISNNTINQSAETVEQLYDKIRSIYGEVTK